MRPDTGMLNFFAFLLFAISFFLAPSTQAQSSFLIEDSTSAVILVYHRIDENEHTDSSIRLGQFQSHIEELLSGAYNVIALPDLVSAIQNGRTLPDRSVVITFDGGYQSAFKSAFPILLENDLPFTAFLSPSLLETGDPQFAGADEFKKLARNNLVTIGVHPDSYIRLSGKPAEEIRRQINNAITSYRHIFKQNPAYFAYPFGEYSQAYQEIIKAAGFEAAFGHQSGVAYQGWDKLSLPRFALTENYGDLDRFRLVVNALPLPVTNISPSDPFSITRQPAIGFSVSTALKDEMENISCFSLEPLTRSTIAETRVELRFAEEVAGDRARINCTLPAANLSSNDNEETRWRWLGFLLTFAN